MGRHMGFGIWKWERDCVHKQEENELIIKNYNRQVVGKVNPYKNSPEIIPLLPE